MKKNLKGSTLAMCVMILAMLSIFITGLWGILVTSRKQKMTELSNEQGFYLSDSCISLTEARLKLKVIDTASEVLSDINGSSAEGRYTKVPRMYNTTIFDTTGVSHTVTRAYSKEMYKAVYMNYVMQTFSASPGEARTKFEFNDAVDDDDLSLSSEIFTLNLCAAGTPTANYTIEANILQNTIYDNFYAVYNACYPDTYTEDENGNRTPTTVPNAEELEKNLLNNMNTGTLIVVYTIRVKDPDGNSTDIDGDKAKIVEKVRVTYTFDLYTPIKHICDSMMPLIFNEEGTDISAVTIDVTKDDLKFKARREYLQPKD